MKQQCYGVRSLKLATIFFLNWIVNFLNRMKSEINLYLKLSHVKMLLILEISNQGIQRSNYIQSSDGVRRQI